MAVWHAPLLRLVADGSTISAAARAVGVSSSAVYAAKRVDADFAAALVDALEDSSDLLEAEARRRAVIGVQEPVIHQGQLTPVWSRDADGAVVMEPAGAPDGDGVIPMRPKQAVDDEGRPVWLTVTKYSDPLLSLLLKGRRKAVFADRTELTGADGGAVVMDDAARAARIAQLMAVAQTRAAAADDLKDIA